MGGLTDEAKIHLATKVFDWSYVHIYEGEAFFYKGCKPPTGCPDIQLHLSEYNPDDIESIGGAKYLRDLLNSLTDDQKNDVIELFALTGALNRPDKVVEYILKITGYKGETR